MIALGLGAQVTILERSVDRMRHLEETLHGRVSLLMSSTLQIEESVRDADVVIGAVLIPGALAPKLLTREMVAGMKDGSVFCDVAIDQGGCAETSHATTHDDPVYEVDGVTHYCVANMPGAVPITSTKALTNVTLPYVEAIAEHGLAEAVARDKALARGVNVLDGRITYEAVAEAHGLEYTPLEDVLGASRSRRLRRRPSCALELLLALRRAELDDAPRDGGGEPDDRRRCRRRGRSARGRFPCAP